MSSRQIFWESIKNARHLGGSFKRLFIHDPNYVPEEDLDSAPYEDRVKTWWWVTGVLITIIVSCALLGTQFHLGV
jgi:hypothetical protein